MMLRKKHAIKIFGSMATGGISILKGKKKHQLSDLRKHPCRIEIIPCQYQIHPEQLCCTLKLHGNTMGLPCLFDELWMGNPSNPVLCTWKQKNIRTAAFKILLLLHQINKSFVVMTKINSKTNKMVHHKKLI